MEKAEYHRKKFNDAERDYILERAEHHMRENPKKYWDAILSDFKEEFGRETTPSYTRQYLGDELKKLRIKLTEEGVNGLPK